MSGLVDRPLAALETGEVILILVLPITSQMTLDKAMNLSVP